MKHGNVRVQTFAVELTEGARVNSVTVIIGERILPAKATQNGSRVEVTLDEKQVLTARAKLEISIALLA